MATANPSKNYSTQLDSTHELLNRGLESAQSIAPRNIMGWAETLSYEGLGHIAAEMERLEELISSPEINPSELSACFQKISELTIEAAAQEEGAQGHKIRELGEMLGKMAQTIHTD
jgi:hypothetical protein